MTDPLRARCAELEALYADCREVLTATQHVCDEQREKISALQAKVDALMAEPFTAGMAALIDAHSGDELHRLVDALICEKMRALGFGEGVDLFLAVAEGKHG